LDCDKALLCGMDQREFDVQIHIVFEVRITTLHGIASQYLDTNT
jgi:hypothetical protein